VPRRVEWAEDGSRPCFICGKKITACMGFVMAGDFVLAMEGKISKTAVRERCGSCVARYTSMRDGDWGPYCWLATRIHDAFRYLSWHTQKRLRSVRYPVERLGIAQVLEGKNVGAGCLDEGRALPDC
jgi:hypothetical protein